MDSRLVKGYASGILSAVAYGTNPLFGKRLFLEGMTPGAVLFYRYFLAALLLGGYLCLTRQPLAVSRKRLPALALAGVLLFFSGLFWFMGFREMHSGIGATILFVYPALVAATMFLFYGEKCPVRTMAGGLAALGGVALLCLGGEGQVTLRGVSLVLLSALSYALYMVELKVSRRLQGLAAGPLTFHAMVFSLPLFFLSMLLAKEGLQGIPSGNAWGNLLGLALLPSFLSYTLLAVSIALVGPTKTAILGALEPLTAVVLGILAFQEPVTWQGALGFLVVIGAMLCVIHQGKGDSSPS